VSDAVALAPRAARVNLGGWWIAPPLVVLALLFLYPLILIARAALIDDAGDLNFAAAWEVLNSRAFLNALINTAEIALASTIGCVILGLTLGLILAFAPFPARAWSRRSSTRSSHCRPSW
jgi:2-aminoethylphosphonate transport system permease protein